MSKFVIDSTTLSSIGDAVREKDKTTALIKVSDIPARIKAIPSGGGDVPEEAFTFARDCSHIFKEGNWNWFIEQYANQITTKDITNCVSMFAKSFTNSGYWNLKLFDINLASGDGANGAAANYMFQGNAFLQHIPKITGKIGDTQGIFQDCGLIELKEESVAGIDWSYHESQTSMYSGYRSYTFDSCVNLRKVPMSFLNHGNPKMVASYGIYHYLFNGCYVLDEVIGLPNPHYNAEWTSTAFGNSVRECMRLKSFTFATNEDGTPFTVNWKSQTLDLSRYVGYADNDWRITNNAPYHGITADKRVTDDTSYQALKNNPDWWTTNIAYCRYNHDSAVETINSLPDTSAYLASKGGTNTIKFKGASGELTDGGAINTLTEEEIAVATAKGWTVTIS